VFNCERYITEALDSVFAQTLRPAEIVVVDDGSTDGTAEIVARYPKSGVRYQRQENKGPAAARNRGVEATKGEFIAFLDADDLWLPDKLEKQMARFDARPELGYVTTHFQSFWTPDLAEQEDTYNDPRNAQIFPGYLLQTMLVRREIMDRIGILDESFLSGEDQEWFLRAEDAGVVLEMLPEVLLRRRLHPDNLTRRLASEVQKNLVRLAKLNIERRHKAATRGREE
jgi:glycosyltransferase involved in cell wall biosynthesis